MTTAEIEHIKELAAKPVIADEHELVSVRKDHLRDLLIAYANYTENRALSAFGMGFGVVILFFIAIFFFVGRH